MRFVVAGVIAGFAAGAGSALSAPPSQRAVSAKYEDHVPGFHEYLTMQQQQGLNRLIPPPGTDQLGVFPRELDYVDCREFSTPEFLTLHAKKYTDKLVETGRIPREKAQATFICLANEAISRSGGVDDAVAMNCAAFVAAASCGVSNPLVSTGIGLIGSAIGSLLQSRKDEHAKKVFVACIDEATSAAFITDAKSEAAKAAAANSIGPTSRDYLTRLGLLPYDGGDGGAKTKSIEDLKARMIEAGPPPPEVQEELAKVALTPPDSFEKGRAEFKRNAKSLGKILGLAAAIAGNPADAAMVTSTFDSMVTIVDATGCLAQSIASGAAAGSLLGPIGSLAGGITSLISVFTNAPANKAEQKFRQHLVDSLRRIEEKLMRVDVKLDVLSDVVKDEFRKTEWWQKKYSNTLQREIRSLHVKVDEIALGKIEEHERKLRKHPRPTPTATKHASAAELAQLRSEYRKMFEDGINFACVKSMSDSARGVSVESGLTRLQELRAAPLDTRRVGELQKVLQAFVGIAGPAADHKAPNPEFWKRGVDVAIEAYTRFAALPPDSGAEPLSIGVLHDLKDAACVGLAYLAFTDAIQSPEAVATLRDALERAQADVHGALVHVHGETLTAAVMPAAKEAVPKVFYSMLADADRHYRPLGRPSAEDTRMSPEVHSRFCERLAVVDSNHRDRPTRRCDVYGDFPSCYGVDQAYFNNEFTNGYANYLASLEGACKLTSDVPNVPAMFVNRWFTPHPEFESSNRRGRDRIVRFNFRNEPFWERPPSDTSVANPDLNIAAFGLGDRYRRSILRKFDWSWPHHPLDWSRKSGQDPYKGHAAQAHDAFYKQLRVLTNVRCLDELRVSMPSWPTPWADSGRAVVAAVEHFDALSHVAGAVITLVSPAANPPAAVRHDCAGWERMRERLLWMCDARDWMAAALPEASLLTSFHRRLHALGTLVLPRDNENLHWRSSASGIWTGGRAENRDKRLESVPRIMGYATVAIERTPEAADELSTFSSFRTLHCIRGSDPPIGGVLRVWRESLPAEYRVVGVQKLLERHDSNVTTTVLHLEGGGALSRRVVPSPQYDVQVHFVRPGETEAVPLPNGYASWYNAPVRDPAITSRIDALAMAMAHSAGEKKRRVASCTPN